MYSNLLRKSNIISNDILSASDPLLSFLLDYLFYSHIAGNFGKSLEIIYGYRNPLILAGHLIFTILCQLSWKLFSVSCWVFVSFPIIYWHLSSASSSIDIELLIPWHLHGFLLCYELHKSTLLAYPMSCLLLDILCILMYELGYKLCYILFLSLCTRLLSIWVRFLFKLFNIPSLHIIILLRSSSFYLQRTTSTCLKYHCVSFDSSWSVTIVILDVVTSHHILSSSSLNSFNPW